MNWYHLYKLSQTKNWDWNVSLECICADDFGSSYKDKLIKDDIDNIKKYNETRNAHQRLKALAEESGIRNYIIDTNDRHSKHSDAYLYFQWSNINQVLKILNESGALGDIIDVPSNFPLELQQQAKEYGWTIEEGYNL